MNSVVVGEPLGEERPSASRAPADSTGGSTRAKAAGAYDVLRARREDEGRRLEALLRDREWCSADQLELARRELANASGAGARLEHVLRRHRALTDHQLALLHKKLGWRLSACPECEAPTNVAGLGPGSHTCTECGEPVRLDPATGELVRGDASRPSRRKALAALEVESFLVLSTAIERRLLTASDVYGLVERFGLGPQVIQELAHAKKLDVEEMAALCKLARADGLLEPESLGRAGRLLALEGAEHPARPDLRLALETATQSIERLGLPLSAEDRENLVLERLVAGGHLTSADRRICEALKVEDAARGRTLPLYRYALRAGRLSEPALDRVLAEVAAQLGDGAPPTTSSQTRPDGVSREGDRFAGYRLIRRLGRGGMGTVYLVEDAAGRRLALKTLRTEGPATPRQIRRFRVEAEAVARLDHPGIIRIVDTGLEDDVHYFTMEYVDGPTLAHLVDGGELSRTDRVELLAKVLDALEHAHTHHVLHRDLKPSNILVDAEGQPKVTDFGLAKMLDSEGTRLTRSGDAVGTPSYMPPEQVAGTLGELSPASDTYSCGVLLYQLLCGRLPFSGATAMELYFRILEGHAAPPSRYAPDVPLDLDRVCQKALARDPRDRYATAADFALDLRRVAAGRRPSARPPGPLVRVARRLGRVELRHGLGAALVIGTVLIVADLLVLTRRTADALRRRRAEHTRFHAASLVAQGEIALELHQQEAARFCFEQAVALEAHPRAWAGLAAVDLEAGRLAQAEWRARVASACRPDEPRHRTLLGRIAEARGDRLGALAAYDAALAIDPGEVEALGRRAALMRAQGHLDRAAADEAAREGPVGVRVAGLVSRARVALERGDPEVAGEHARRAIALAGEHAEAWYLLARCAVEQGQPDLALEHLAGAIARAPAEPRYALAEGRLLERAGRADEALRAFARACEASCTGSAPYELARGLVERGDSAGAALALERASPGHAPARYAALGARIAVLAGNLPRARELARQGIAHLPAGADLDVSADDAEVLLLAAQVGDVDGMEALVPRLERWAERAGADLRGPALEALGIAELARSRPARGRVHLIAARAAGRDGAELHRALAVAAGGVGDVADAVASATRAVQCSPLDARGWSCLARARLAAGDAAGAHTAAAVARRLAPEDGIDPALAWEIAFALRDFRGLEGLAAAFVELPALGGASWGDRWDADLLARALREPVAYGAGPSAAGPVDPLLVAAHLRALITDTPAAQQARSALARGDERFRAVVAHELAQLGDLERRAIEARLPSVPSVAWTDRRAWVRCLALAVVAGDEAASATVAAWGGDDDRVLGEIAADGGAEIVVRRLAARGLALRAGAELGAARELARLRHGGDAVARVVAGWELARLGDASAALGAADIRAVPRSARADLVGACGDRSWLASVQAGEEPREAWEAALALVALGDAGAVAVLERLGPRVEGWRRAYAPAGLVAAGAAMPPAAHVWLAALVADPAPAVARRAAAVLARLGGSHASDVLRGPALGTDPIAARWARVGLGHAGVEVAEGQGTALDVACQIALASEMDERLEAVADDGPVWLRGMAMLRAGARSGRGCLSPGPRVVGALDSPFPQLRAASALALVAWPWWEARLRAQLAAEADPGVRAALGAVLGRWLGYAERGVWLEALAQGDAEVRRAAARELVHLRHRRALELALRLDPTDPEVLGAWAARRE